MGFAALLPTAARRCKRCRRSALRRLSDDGRRLDLTERAARLDPTALTVIGGALAFAVAFAVRDLMAAFIAGLSILFARPFQA